MQDRVHEILLVSSIYESFILEEDGRLDESLIAEYQDLGLVHLPRLRRVVSGTAALERMCADKGPDLIITTAHVGDMAATDFVRRVRSLGLEDARRPPDPRPKGAGDTAGPGSAWTPSTRSSSGRATYAS